LTFDVLISKRTQFIFIVLTNFQYMITCTLSLTNSLKTQYLQ